MNTFTKILVPVAGLGALLLGTISYNVWYADHVAVNKTPGPFEIGQQKLHAQLDASKQREAQIEKQYWDSPGQLHLLILAHEQRIEQLNGNSQAGEIVAHDHESIDRIQKRINDLEAIRAAQPDEDDAEDQEAAAQPKPADGSPK